MPIPIQHLIDPKSKRGLDPDSLKASFDAKTIEKRPKIKAMVENIRDVIRDGINRNRKDYRLFKAMDWAYDSPFYQVSYTQLRGLLSNKADDKKVLETVNQWGLTHLLPNVVDANGNVCCGSDKKPIKAINLPVFFNIFVPIVMSYITIRWAKLFNDRNLVPLYKYEPVQFTKENRLKCEVITQIVQRQSAWFGYPEDERQTILQTLLYGFCINFPREAWFTEKQEDTNKKAKIVREGLRFDMPHPSRIYYDLYHRLSSLNTNSGCEYVGHWTIGRYKDIHNNPLYWNKDRISIGSVGWFDGFSDFLEEVFPYQMSFPTRDTGNGIGGAGSLDRETEAYRNYGQGDFNAATLRTEHFQKLVPKDHGLGDYEYPIWFRIVMASDNAVLWAEPLAFDRFPTYAYDADFNRSRFRSLALEIMPFQDQVGNLMTQWISSIKENLINPIFVDKEKMPAEALKQLQNMGFKEFGGRKFFPFSSTENYRMKIDQREAFYSPVLTRHNTQEIALCIEGVLNMLDRTMQLSPQEIGQAASHEQTAEETKVIAQNTSTRVTFTGSFIDNGDYAKKVMLYDAMMAYADDDIMVGISSAFASSEEELNKLVKSVGLELTDKEGSSDKDPDAVRTVKAKKSALTLESFSSTRDATERIDNPAIADAMAKIFISVAGNEFLIQSIGPVQLVELLNQIIVTAGLPKEFRLRGKAVDTSAPVEEQTQQVSQMITEFAAQVKEAIAQSQQETLQVAAQQTEQIVTATVGQAVTQMAEQITPIAEAVAQNSQVNQVQQKQIEQVQAALAELAKAVEQTAIITQQIINPPQAQVTPMTPAPQIGVPV